MNENDKCVCPLLKNPECYQPDTIDLINNVKERNYWLPCLEEMVKKFVSKAESLNPNNPSALENANNCYLKFHNLVQELTLDPTILKPLSVRTLLDFNEDTLRANNFKDAWFLQKEKESNLALQDFEDRINSIDLIKDFNEKWLDLCKGVLAGNFFDWGARAVSDILEHTNNFRFTQALNTIQKRPWFIDDFNPWVQKLEKLPYKSAVIFVDNAGVDFILGVLPFARELLILGTKVVLTANTLPALNDVTYDDLNMYCVQAAKYCPIINNAIKSGQLVTVENGQRGPCLDLMNITPELSHLMKQADLIVLEGMGRAVHTNLYAKFKIDSLKMAVLKNEWLARSLGAQQFSIIFHYEPAT